MSFSLLHPRDQIVETMHRIYTQNMTTTSGGNLSILDENGDVWITPARVDKGSLRPQDIVCLRADGRIEGQHPPSSEHPFHLSIYRTRSDVNAIVHAHPTALVSFSICKQVPNTRLIPESWAVCGEPAFATYAAPGSQLLGDRIAAQFGADSKPNCVILENHGVVTCGDDLSQAFARFETLEFTAATILNARQIGKVNYLDEDQIAQAMQPRNLLPEAEARNPSSRDKELRKEICDFVHRAYAHRLMTSTGGSFSARIDDETFVITPSDIDRQYLRIEDLVLVRKGERYPGLLPSRAVRLHKAIYDAHPQINAVVNAFPVHATAFSVSDFPLDTRIIPESYVFLKQVSRVPYQQQFGDGKEVASRVAPKQPIALLEHNGVLVAGSTPLDAFDRLEVLEATAEAIIRSKALGEISPMSEDVIQELHQVFAL